MINTRLFGATTNTNLGLARTTEETTSVNTRLFPAAPVAEEAVNTQLFASSNETESVNTVLFANAVEETSTSNDVQTQFDHLNNLLLLEGYEKLANLVAGLSVIYTEGL